jgi:hypothetical protein
LDPAIGKSDRVGACSGITISLLTSAELGTIVVIHSVVISINCRSIISWLLVCRVGRSWGISWCWGIGGCGSISVPLGIRCWCCSSQRSQSQNDESLKIK